MRINTLSSLCRMAVITALVELSSFGPESTLAATVSWIGGNGDWNTSANWSSGVLPGPADDVVIDVPGVITVTHSSGSHTVNSIFCQEALTLSGGTLTISSGSDIPQFTFSAGTLSGSGDLTVSGVLNWTAGTMSGSGKTIIASNGTLNLSGAAAKQLNRVLQNDGIASWTGTGPLQMNAGTFNNNGSFGANSASLLDCYGTGGVNAFNNAGAFTQQGSGETRFRVFVTGVAFNNSGTVNVPGGKLSLNGGGIDSGLLTVQSGATLEFASSYTHDMASLLEGTGAMTFSGGTHSFPAGTFLPTGPVNFSSGSITVNNTINPSALGPVAATLTFTQAQSFSALTLSGTIAGGGDVTVSGVLNWTAGTMSGSGKTIIASSGTLNLSGAAAKQLNRVLQNDGIASWTGTGPLQMNAGTFNNNGSFGANSASLLDCYGTGGVNAFNNAGAFTQQGSGETRFRVFVTGVTFNNSGTVNVQAGILGLDGGGVLDFPGQSVLRSGVGATLRLAGLNLTGSTMNAIDFSPKGRLLFSGSGVRLLEVMGRDFGSLPCGYDHNFAYGAIELATGANVTLVDNADNSPGPDALYVQNLTVPAGTTLNLNGMRVYAGAVTVNGTLIGGTPIIVAEGPGAPPAAAGAIAGAASVCKGQSAVVYSAAAIAGAASYAWSYSGAGATIHGAGNSVTVDFSPSATGGNLTVRGQNSCGDGAVSPNFGITLNPTPGAAGTISGPGDICANATGVTYSIAEVVEASTYTWTVPIGATVVLGQGTLSVAVDFGSASGEITVTPSNSCGSGISSTLAVTVAGAALPIATQETIATCYQTVAAANQAALNATVTDNSQLTKAVRTSAQEGCDTTVVIRLSDPCGNYSDYTYSTQVNGTPPSATQGAVATSYKTATEANQAALDATTALAAHCSGDVTKAVHTSAQEACSTIVVIRVSDACGNLSDYSYSMRVDGPAPQLNGLSNKMVGTDPGASGATVSFDITAYDNCDGAVAVTCKVGTTVITSPSFFPIGTTSVNCSATDSSGNTMTGDFNVVVIATAPVIPPVIANLPLPMTIDCPATPSFAQATATAADACNQTVTLTFVDVTTPGNCPGNYSVKRIWTATDHCANSSSASQTIYVQDVTAPVIAALPLPTTIDCPATPSFAQATATDACDQTVTLTFVDVTTPGNCPGNYSVKRTWTATDDCANTSSASQTIHVQDVTVPVIGVDFPIAPVPITPATSISVSLLADCGATSATINWGDELETEILASGSVAHQYAQAGVYTVVIVYRDECGNEVTWTPPNFLVAYDPNGGFVTGGGWINSPAGAYPKGPTLTGKANFGFVSKYKKGATVPTGETEFQFKLADLNFQSTAYEWLVVSGPKAQFKGSGTINGAGDYGFLLTATDGQVNGGGGLDKFRIKIWNKVTSVSIYDNVPGSDDSISTSGQTVLGGGSVVIHK